VEWQRVAGSDRLASSRKKLATPQHSQLVGTMLAIIIYGWTTKEKTLESTEFFCPTCREHRDGEHRAMKRYFTLYFIPLIPLGTVGEFVHCETCQGQFDTAVLDLTAADVQRLTQPWRCGECGNTNPSDQQRCLKCRCFREEEPATELEFDDD
jgi:hypothetical protein